MEKKKREASNAMALNITATKPAKGSLLGAILLVSGCCIGAGMLGLPLVSAMAGFKPSVIMFVVSWLFMLYTGLLLLEVNLWFSDDVNIVSMAGRTLGVVGKMIAWLVFLFLFYSLMVAYVGGMGELFTDFVRELSGQAILLPSWVGSLIILGVLTILLYLGTAAVDNFNRLLMFGLIISYAALVVMGLPHVNPSFLKHQDWIYTPWVLPAMIISFGFHNLVPSLTTYLNRDKRRLRLTFIIGSAIPLFVYLIWEYLILGLIPLEGEGGFRATLDQGNMVTHALKTAIGSSWVLDFAHYFAFFAIVTSFVAVALSFVDFLSDGLHIPKKAFGKIVLCALALLPPFFFAFAYPKIFILALNYAGGFGAVILFGILPALMAWSGRYGSYSKIRQSEQVQLNEDVLIIPGGKIGLVLVILLSCVVIALQLAHELSTH